MDKIDAKIFKHGNSLAITLNKEALYKSGFNVGDVSKCQMKSGNLVFEKRNFLHLKKNQKILSKWWSI